MGGLDHLGGGAALLLAALLLVAGAAKVVRPAHVAAAVMRLLPDGVRARQPPHRFEVGGRVLGGAEILLGTGLLAHRAVLPVRAAALVLHLGFVGVVVLAARVGASCGCFASFSDGPAAGAELGRAAALAGMAVVAVIDAALDPPGDPLTVGAAVSALVLLTVVVAAMALGGRIRPARVAPATRDPTAWVADLAGSVRSRRVAAGVGPAGEVLSGRTRDRLVDDLQLDPTVAAVVEHLAARGRQPRWSKAAVQRATNTEGHRLTIATVPAAPDGKLRAMVVERPGHPTRIVGSAEVPGATSVSREGIWGAGAAPASAATVPE